MNILKNEDQEQKCFKVDYNNNQIEVTYNKGADSSIFPIIIDDSDDDEKEMKNKKYNEISDEYEDFDEFTDELNRNYYQRRLDVNSNRDSTSNNKKQNMEIKKPDEDEEEDEMYKSLRRLSKALSQSTSLNKLSNNAINRKQSVIPFQPNLCKKLTFYINEIYFTNGITPVEIIQRTNRLQTKFYSKKKILTKSIRCIGTSMKNFVQSDVVSIDIDQKSTFLPMMCKLMIITQGAVLERGVPVLVRDIAVQVSLNFNGETRILEEINTSSDYSTSIIDSLNESDDDNDEDDENDEDSYDRVFRNKTVQFSKSTSSTRKRIIKKRYDNISGRRNSYYRRQSYYNLNEYTSIPYYQYQNISLDKNNQCDVECMTDDYYLTSNNNIMIINSTNNKNATRDIPIQFEEKEIKIDTSESSSTCLKEDNNDEVEVAIPIKVENSRPIKVNQGVFKYQNVQKTIYEEKYNRFEHEVNIYNKNRASNFLNKNKEPVIYRFFNFDNNNAASATNASKEENNKTDNCASNTNQPFIEIENSKSVTHVYLGHVINGNLKL